MRHGDRETQPRSSMRGNALAVIPAEAWELAPKDGSLTGHICRDLFLPGWRACFVHVSVV